MTLWIILLLLCLATIIGVSFPFSKRKSSEIDAMSDQAIYADQIAEIEMDLKLGNINQAESILARSEIQRRLENSSKAKFAEQPLAPKTLKLIFYAMVVTIFFGSSVLYSQLGSPNLPSAAPQARPQLQSAENPPPQQVEDLLQELRVHLQKNPTDAPSWRMLGWSEFNLQHFEKSAEAYAKAADLEPNNMDYKSAYAEALVQMAAGFVTEKAKVVIAEVLINQPKDSRARFYDALAEEQSGSKPKALDKWIALLADAPDNASWREEVIKHVIELGKATGRDVSSTTAGPISDQQEMIEGMVNNLANKLVANPNDLDGWLRLMRSYKVLNQPDKAKAALQTAQTTFAGDPTSLEKISAAARELEIN